MLHRAYSPASWSSGMHRPRVGREEVPVDADGASDTAQEVLQGRDRGQPRDTRRQALQDRHGEEGPLHQVHNEDRPI